MKYIDLNGNKVSSIVAGCMRISSFDDKQIEEYVKGCMELGINFFDHADIYGGGKCEELFGRYLKNHPEDREKMFIQSKCGIKENEFDFSYEHIIESVEESLKRLNIDYLDSLLLHRPDALMEPEEVNRAFNRLYSDGKVKSFGVSNMNRYQMHYLQKSSDYKLNVDQLQMSVVFTPMIDAGLNVNMENDAAIMRDGGTLEYIKENDMVLQIWSPLQVGYFEGPFIDNPKYKELNDVLSELSIKYHCQKDSIAYAWLLRYPTKVQVITGSTNPEHIRSAAASADITLSRKEWYSLYLAAGNKLP